MASFRRGLVALIVAIFCALTMRPALLRAQTIRATNPSLESGFGQLYRVQFSSAREIFQKYEQQQPADPMGPASEAAGYLFDEFNRQGVLTSTFFLDDKKLLGGVDHPPDPNLREGFLGAVARARQLANEALKRDANDTNALIALTMCAGMQSDYEALIERKQLSSLHYMREAQENAQKLLAQDPGAGDAYVAMGSADYIIACMPSYKRAFLWLGGVHGDKQRGMEQLRKASAQGRYLQPFAKIMLALASLREGQPEQARELYAQLTKQFPENPVFPHELAFATERANAAKPCMVAGKSC